MEEEGSASIDKKISYYGLILFPPIIDKFKKNELFKLWVAFFLPTNYHKTKNLRPAIVY